MKTTVLQPRDFIKWFVKEYKIDGEEMKFVQTNNGRTITLSDMSDEDAEFVAAQFMLMMSKPEGTMQ